jgi:hypothetical protein
MAVSCDLKLLLRHDADALDLDQYCEREQHMDKIEAKMRAAFKQALAEAYDLESKGFEVRVRAIMEADDLCHDEEVRDYLFGWTLNSGENLGTGSLDELLATGKVELHGDIEALLRKRTPH